MSLLFATNFSEAATRASTAAARLAARSGQKLWLVHVQPESSARAFGETLRRTAERALRDEAERLGGLAAEVGTALLTGPLHEALTSFGARVEAELLVVGEPSEPPTTLGLGGTLDRVLVSTPLPLLVIKDAAALEAWAAGERPLRVMLGVDRSETTEAARAWVAGLRRFGPVELVAGHVFFPFEECRRLGLPLPVSFDEVSPELRQAVEGEVATLAGPGPDGAPVPVRLALGIGRKADHLVALARDARADLLVVGTHHRRALGKLWSVSHQALRLAPMSLACVPATAAPHGAQVPLPQVRRVLVATDLSPLGNRAVPYAFSLVQPGGTVVLLHVGEALVSPDMGRALEAQLRALVPEAARLKGTRALPEVLAQNGADVATRIAQAAERHDADLVCLGSHGRAGVREVVLGSVARAVVGHVRRPVLVVRPPER